MSCDIYCFAEVKYKAAWKFAGEVQMERHYDIFAKMAGVRNDDDMITPIALPRDVPVDADDLTKLVLSDKNYHTHSYLSLSEMKVLDKWVEKSEDGKVLKWRYIKWPYSIMKDNLKIRYYKIEDIRFVFAFEC